MDLLEFTPDSGPLGVSEERFNAITEPTTKAINALIDTQGHYGIEDVAKIVVPLCENVNEVFVMAVYYQKLTSDDDNDPMAALARMLGQEGVGR